MPEAAKHAPGPWKFFEGDSSRMGMSTIVQECDESFLIGYAICEPVNKAARASDIENARVMAAAPVLLEACQRMLAAFGNCGTPVQQEAADYAAKAIAAATQS